MRHTIAATAAIAVFMVSRGAFAADTKLVIHFSTLPLIEGAGIYASVASLADRHASANTQVASGVDLALLATQATLGMVTAFSSGERRTKVRSVHHVIAYLVAATGLWLGVANSVDHSHDHSNTGQQIGAYAEAGLAMAPIIMFSF